MITVCLLLSTSVGLQWQHFISFIPNCINYLFVSSFIYLSIWFFKKIHLKHGAAAGDGLVKAKNQELHADLLRRWQGQSNWAIICYPLKYKIWDAGLKSE